MTDILESLAYMYGKPDARAKVKAEPEHFVVKEILGYEFTGSGEHFMVRIRKTGENTSFVANELAKACGVKSKDVGWAGLKDRHAVAEQWFSVHLPKSEDPDLSSFEQQYPSIEVLKTDRHNKKLRPGDLSGNQFQLTLSEVSDVEKVEERVKAVMQGGVPNYFGAQRFGREGNNLTEARRWGREKVRTRNQNKRSLYLSTARSWIFNHIVSDRADAGLLSTLVKGDIVSSGGELIDISENNLAQYQGELDCQKVVITAAMAGDNNLPTKDATLSLEQRVVDSEPDLMALIRGNRMRHDRREVTLRPEEMSYHIENDMVTLYFSLPSGSFATSVVRELVEEIPVERQFD